jgi:hypothetical protein
MCTATSLCMYVLFCVLRGSLLCLHLRLPLCVTACTQGEATKRAAAAAAAAEAERQRFFFAASLGSKVHVDDDDVITVPPFDRELFTDDSTAAEAAAATAAAAAAAGTDTLLLEADSGATAAASSDDAAEYSDALDGSDATAAATAATASGGEDNSPQNHRPSVYTSVDISEEGWLDDLVAEQDAMQEQGSTLPVPVSALPLAEHHEHHSHHYHHDHHKQQQQQQQQHISAAASQYLAAKSSSAGYAGSECSSEGMQSEDEPLFRHLRDSTLDDSTASTTAAAVGSGSTSSSAHTAHSRERDSAGTAPLQQSTTADAAASGAASVRSADTHSSSGDAPARLEPLKENAVVLAPTAELSTEEHALGISSDDERYSDAVAAFASASPHAVLLQELQQCDTAALAVAAVAVAGAGTATDARTAAIAALQAEVEQVEAAAAAAAAARRRRWAQEEAEDRARLQKKKSFTKVIHSTHSANSTTFSSACFSVNTVARVFVMSDAQVLAVVYRLMLQSVIRFQSCIAAYVAVLPVMIHCRLRDCSSHVKVSVLGNCITALTQIWTSC